MVEHTPGPWLREGRTVYALQDGPKGAENRFIATVQGKAPATELAAIAQVMEASPDLLTACSEVMFSLIATQERKRTFSYELGLLRAAIAKATGQPTSGA